MVFSVLGVRSIWQSYEGIFARHVGGDGWRDYRRLGLDGNL